MHMLLSVMSQTTQRQNQNIVASPRCIHRVVMIKRMHTKRFDDQTERRGLVAFLTKEVETIKQQSSPVLLRRQELDQP